ncbi:MAG: penicillin-binding protein 2 [Patescibacteria group bacterium]
MKDHFRRRVVILGVIIIGCVGGIITRLFWLQVLDHDIYEAKAAQQHSVERVLRARRGEILLYEKDNVVPVATTKQGWLLAINPSEIGSPETLYELLTTVGGLTLDREEFFTKAAKKEDPYEIIAHRVSHDAKTAIVARKPKGVTFSEEQWRFYPAGDFASQVIGFVGADGEGKYGLERYYNSDFEGEDGVFHGEETSGGRLLSFAKKLISPQRDGATVVLTIDAGVQTYLQKELNGVQRAYHARSAGGIIIEPKTGRILAMAAVPSFNPNEYFKQKDVGVFQNPNVESRFEMGSVVKPLTMAAAIDSGAVNRDTTYNDTGERTFDTLTVRNFDGKARGVVNIQEILSQSLNMGSVFLMERMGKETFRRYMTQYQIGESTHIDLPNEVTGDIRNLESTRMIEFATASFGQGISMTPMEFVRALSSLANEGNLTHPYLVEKIRHQDGSEVLRKPQQQERVLKQETATEVTRMLVRVVDEKLANGKGKIPGYAVAAKTGTAQMASGNGYGDEFLHTFFGYGPAFDPRFLVFLFLERPQGVRYASETLTQPFRSTIQYLFSYYEVPPDRPQT